MDNWLSVTAKGRTRRLEEEVDAGYAADGTAPKDTFAHSPPGTGTHDAVERERKRLGK